MTTVESSRRQWIACLLLALITPGAISCSDRSSATEQPKFSAMPLACTNAFDFAGDAIRRSAESLYDPELKPSESPPSKAELDVQEVGKFQKRTCNLSYKYAGPQADLPQGTPVKREIYVFYSLYIDHPDPVGAARRAANIGDDLQRTSRSPFGHGADAIGIGEDTETFWDTISDSANVEFRISNLNVHVFITGENRHTGITAPMPPELRTRLEVGSVPIARGIAAGLRSS